MLALPGWGGATLTRPAPHVHCCTEQRCRAGAGCRRPRRQPLRTALHLPLLAPYRRTVEALLERRLHPDGSLDAALVLTDVQTGEPLARTALEGTLAGQGAAPPPLPPPQDVARLQQLARLQPCRRACKHGVPDVCSTRCLLVPQPTGLLHLPARPPAAGPCNWGDLSARFDPASRRLHVRIALQPPGSSDGLRQAAAGQAGKAMAAGANGAALASSSGSSDSLVSAVSELPPPSEADEQPPQPKGGVQARLAAAGAQAQPAAGREGAPVTPQLSDEAEAAAAAPSHGASQQEEAAAAGGGEADGAAQAKKKKKKKKKKKGAAAAAADGAAEAGEGEEEEEEQAGEAAPAAAAVVPLAAAAAEAAPEVKEEEQQQAAAEPVAAEPVAAEPAAADEAPAIPGRTELGATVPQSQFRCRPAGRLHGMRDEVLRKIRRGCVCPPPMLA